MSSIDHGHENEPADTPAEQIAADGSIGSDTDTGGPLRSENTNKDGSNAQHHTRSNSVKKPTTFKAVSVTKNFLAKAGAPTTPAAKTNGENGNVEMCCRCDIRRLIKSVVTVPANANNTMPPAARPRLVAKSASGTKGTGPNKPSFGTKTGSSGPDPMQVWNRNRGDQSQTFPQSSMLTTSSYPSACCPETFHRRGA